MTATVSSTNYILGQSWSHNEEGHFCVFYHDLPDVGKMCKFQNKGAS